MARVKLIFPEKACSDFTIPVRITDINYGNHVGNDAIVSIMHEARMLWLTAGDYSELAVGGASLIMADLAVEYKNESFYGDVLTVKVCADNISTVSFEIYYKLTTEDGKLIALGKSGMVCFDYDVRKVKAIPEKFKTFLEG